MVTLLLTEKGGETKQLNFDKDEVTIGRVQGNDIVLPKGQRLEAPLPDHGPRWPLLRRGPEEHQRHLHQRPQDRRDDRRSSAADKIYVGDFVIKVENAGGDAAPARAPPEAGSLSTALPRRPPPPPRPAAPPPPCGRWTTSRWPRSGRAPRRAAPCPRRRPRRASPRPRRPRPRPLDDGLPDLEVGPPPAADVDMDDEALPPRPRLPVPPLKSPRPLTEDDRPRGRGRTLRPGARRAACGPASCRGTPAATAGSPPRAPGSADGLAAWLRDLLASEGRLGGLRQRLAGRDRAQRPARARRSAAGRVPGRRRPRAGVARGSPRPAGDTRVINVMLPENARLAAIFPPVASELCADPAEAGARPGASLQALVDSGVLSPDEARSCSRPASAPAATS